MILVSVGTDHHPFDRLLKAVARWAQAIGREDLCVQHGYSSPVPGAENYAFLPRRELIELFKSAEIVVTQVGPGTILDANSVGRKPISMPRSPGRGEHVDGHQLAFGRAMSRRGAVTLVLTEADLLAALDSAAENVDLTHLLARKSPATETARTLGAKVDQIVGSPAPLLYPSRLLPALRRLSQTPKASRD